MFHLNATANKTNKQKKVNKVNVNNNGMYKLKLTVREEGGEKKMERKLIKSCMINAVFLDASSCFSQTHNWS